MENLPEGKLYWNTKELAQYLDEPVSTVRYWQDEFSQYLRPKTTASGKYQFSRNDLKTALLIKHLLKDKGFTLKGAKEHLKNRKATNIDKKEIIDTLLAVRKQLYDIRAELNSLKADDENEDEQTNII